MTMHPWTRRQLQDALRAAGWQRIPGPAAVYRSPRGATFSLDEYKAPLGVLWRFYAARRELPSDEPVVRGRLRRPSSVSRSARPAPAEPAPRAPKPPNANALSALAFVRAYKAANGGVAPSIREIGDALEVSSTSQVRFYLDRLEAHGLIRRRPGVPRWIEVLDTPASVMVEE